MARSGGEANRLYSGPGWFSKELSVASPMCSRTLLYVLQDDFADLLAVGAADGKADCPGEFLHPHGELLSASRAYHLNAFYFAFFIHTPTKIFYKNQ